MLLSPCELKLMPSPETSTFKKEPNQRISLTNCIYHPYITFHSQLTVIELFPNMSMPSLADPAKLKKLVNTFLWTPQIRLRDAMTIAKYPNEEIKDKTFCRFLQRALPGSFLKAFKAQTVGVIPPPPNHIQQ
jgi:hypothetical protein